MVGRQRVRKGRHGRTMKCMRTAMRPCFSMAKVGRQLRQHGGTVLVSDDGRSSESPRASIAGRCNMWIPVNKFGQGVCLDHETKIETMKRAVWSLNRCVMQCASRSKVAWTSRLGNVVGGTLPTNGGYQAACRSSELVSGRPYLRTYMFS